jgi:hypothetical protein
MGVEWIRPVVDVGPSLFTAPLLSLDHLVGALLKKRRHVEAEGLRNAGVTA